MYRQPENSNRVKSMKNRFEGLNVPNSTSHDKSKNLPIRNTICIKSSIINGKVINAKQKQKENNNNDYKSTLENKKENQNLKISPNRIKVDDSKNKKDKFGDKNSIDKDFSDVNKKELCSVPPLNLTRQLNDPSKKGCIKRTPAFRKDKSVNNRMKTSEDLNFANIVKLFENNDNKEVCDTVDSTKIKIMTNSDNNLNSDTIQVSSVSKQSLNLSVSLTDKSKIHSVQKLKLTSSLSNVTNAEINKATHKSSEAQKQTLTSSSSLIFDKNNIKTNLVLPLKKSVSSTFTEQQEDKSSNVTTLKISEKRNRFSPAKESVPLVKEIIQTLSNSEHKSLINETKMTEITLPAYAQVVKPKKKETITGNCDIALTDTLKAALKQPLPSGPPPKKPPRTFTHTPNSKSKLNESSIDQNHQEVEPVTNQIDAAFCERSNENLAHGLPKTNLENDKKPVKIKSDPKLMLQKLENALLNNKIRSPKLSKKLKNSPSSSNTQANLYTAETPQKNLFPNCLPSLNCVSKTSASNAYAKITPKVGTSSMSTFFADVTSGTSTEPIYAEPFEFQIKQDSPKPSRIGFFRNNSHDGRADTLTNSLHYMSNPVVGEWNRSPVDVLSSDDCATRKQEDSDCNKREKNAGESESGSLNRHKLNLIMNQTYATPSPSDSDMESLPSTPSSDDTPQSSKTNTIKDLILSFEQKHQLEPTSLNIPSTVKQKLTVSSSWPAVIREKKNISEKQAHESEPSVEEKKKFKTQLNRTLTEIRKTYVRRVCSTLKRKAEVKEEVSHLFECCLLVGLNVSDLTPYIKSRYPAEYEVPPWVEHLCFPDATEWSSKLTSSNICSQDCQCYSLVITDENGDRKYGYCRRVVPEEASVCLPLTYCIISSIRATGFYHKVLQELESRHGLPFGLQEAFVRELYNCKFPQPGESVKISCLLRSLVVNSCEEMIKNQQITSPENVECVRRLVNMQNGVYGTLKKINDRKRDVNNEWTLEEDSNFRTPKNTYGNKSESETQKNENSFDKISKYSKEFRRCNSVTNSNDSLDSLDNLDILRPKQNISFIHQNQNTRSSEPQINKRVGHLFDDINLSDSSDIQATELLKIENDNRTCSSPLLHLPNSQLLHDCLLGDVELKRPHDSRLEDADLTTLFNTLDLVTLLQTFGSLLHERKVIFVSNCLSKLSSCVEALQSILYPFSWQHTFIPVLSNNMLDILSAPLPLIAGVLASHITETLIIEEGIAVNLDTSTVVCYMGDENDIIPKRLQKGLITSLQLVTEATEADDRSRNVLVSEAFIRMFVEVCGCYKQFITINEFGKRVFEKELFIKNHPSKSKCLKFFLEWFSETAMFNYFIQAYLKDESTELMFEHRCTESNSSAALQKNLKVAQKVKHFGHKLFQIN